MMPQSLPVLRHKAAGLWHPLSRLSVDKGRIVIVWDKADFLTVRLVRHHKSRFRSHLPDLLLRVRPHRHERMGELFLCETVESVSLILFRRHRVSNGISAVCKPHDPRVVSRGDIIRPDLQTPVEHGLPLHITVAGDAWIGRAPGLVALHEIIHDPPAERAAEIEYIVLHPQPAAGPAGVLHRLQGAARPLLGLTDILVIVQPQGAANRLIPRLPQQQGGGGAVHSAAHAGQDLLPFHRSPPRLNPDISG